MIRLFPTAATASPNAGGTRKPGGTVGIGTVGAATADSGIETATAIETGGAEVVVPGSERGTGMVAVSVIVSVIVGEAPL